MPVQHSMKRTIGLWGAVVTLVGFVIGVAVFILPAELAAQTGPAVILSFNLASVMALFSCFVGAQIGAVFPVSGASFVSIARLVSPFFGFIYIWLTLAGVAIAIALVAMGFAHYFSRLVPGIDPRLIAGASVIFFGVLNLMGARASVWGQGLMVVAFMTVLVVFCGVGMTQVDTALIVPFAPMGSGPVIAAAVPAYFAYLGFQIIIELGGEIKQPERNIPLALFISFVVVWLTYSLVSLVVVGVVPWQELGSLSTPFLDVAAKILPGSTSTLITLTVLAAAASSINGLLFGFSREVMVLARVRIFPEILGKVSVHGEPVSGVVVLVLAALVVLFVEGSIGDYATVCVLALMYGQMLLGLVVVRISRREPDRYARCGFRLKPALLSFLGYGLILFSLIFLCVGIIDSPKSVLVSAVLGAVGALYYFLRRNYLRSIDVSVEAQIAKEVSSLGLTPVVEAGHVS